jgi:hypothetical protein
MKYMYSQSEGAGKIGNGLIKRWAGCAFGVVLFLSAAGSVALAQSAVMTQQQYLQWMANVCGEALPASATGADLVNWARGKGMNPTGGWNLGAKLSKDVMAQTLVQLLNLAPRKGSFDATRLLEREGIVLQVSSDGVTIKNFVSLIDSGFGPRVRPGAGWGNDKDGVVHTGPPGREDDVPTFTHPHGGPPGHTGDLPGKGNQRRN